MSKESIRRVLDEVERTCDRVAAARQSNRGDVFAALHACALAAPHATAESARDFAIAMMAELTATIAEAERMGDAVVARVSP